MGGAVGAGVGGQDAQGGVGLLGGDLPELALDGHEEPVLVAGVADDQLDAGRGSVGQGLPGHGGQHLAVHDGREGRLQVRGLAPSRVGGHLVGHLVRGVAQPGGGEAGQFAGGGRQAQVAGDGGGDVGGERLGEVQAGHALRDRPVEEAGGAGHGHQRGDAAGSRGLAEDGDPAGIAAEGGDVVLDPAERGDLVEEPAVGRRSGKCPKPSAHRR